VVIDLARVTFLDCAGIGTLVAGRNAAARRGCGYTVVNPQRKMRRVLELTGVLTALTRRRWSEQCGHDDPGAVEMAGAFRWTADTGDRRVFVAHRDRSW
jgi:hypothetical protein